MGNVLDPRIGSSGPGSNPGQVTVLIVLLGKTLTSHSALSTQEYKWFATNCQGNLTEF